MEPRLNIKQLLIYSLLLEHGAALRTSDGSVALAINLGGLLTYLLTYLICTPFNTANSRKSLYFTVSLPFSLKIFPSCRNTVQNY